MLNRIKILQNSKYIAYHFSVQDQQTATFYHNAIKDWYMSYCLFTWISQKKNIIRVHQVSKTFCPKQRTTTGTIKFITVFTVFRLLADFVCLYNYEFWLSLCKIVRSSVILLLPLFIKVKNKNTKNTTLLEQFQNSIEKS
jgi:hypothetical protein